MKTNKVRKARSKAYGIGVSAADCDLVIGLKINTKKETIKLILLKNRFSDDFPVKELTMKLKTDKKG